MFWRRHLHSSECCHFFLSPRNALRLGLNAAVVPSVLPSVLGPCEHHRDYTIACFFVKLRRHVDHDERMNNIDFEGQRSKVKVTMDKYGNKLVNTIETKLFCISLSNLTEMLTMVRGWTIDFGGQRSNVKVIMDIYGNKLVFIKAT